MILINIHFYRTSFYFFKFYACLKNAVYPENFYIDKL